MIEAFKTEDKRLIKRLIKAYELNKEKLDYKKPYGLTLFARIAIHKDTSIEALETIIEELQPNLEATSTVSHTKILGELYDKYRKTGKDKYFKSMEIFFKHGASQNKIASNGNSLSDWAKRKYDFRTLKLIQKYGEEDLGTGGISTRFKRDREKIAKWEHYYKTGEIK